MSPQPDEPMPQDQIDRIAALYREASGEQPSARHDTLVLAAARADLAAVAKSKSGASRKWRVPVAFAATLVLTVALTISVEREQSREDAVSPAPLMREAPVAGTRPAPVQNAPAKPEVKQRVPQVAPGSAKDEAQAHKAESVPSAGKLDAPAPAATPKSPEPPVESKSAPSPVVPAEAAKPRYVPAPPDGGNARDAAAAQSDVAPALRKQLSAPPAPASAPSPLFAPAPPPQPEGDAAQKSRANTSTGGLRERDSGAAPTQLTPRQWIDKIRSLRRAGRDADADAALMKFKLAFPDYPIPEDIAGK
jgi:hypothetical protein